MPEEKSTRIPAPVYAAAGVGELAYQKLRKLPVVVGELSGKAVAGTFELREKVLTGTAELREKATGSGTELRQKAVTGGAELRERALATWRIANSTAAGLRERAATTELDAERLREVAKRNAAAVLAGAQAAQERAAAVYEKLVARGERVIGAGIVDAAGTVNADIEATETAEVTATPATVAEAVSETPAEKKPVPAARKATKAAKRTSPSA